jgi:hypothetical protein
MRPTVIDVHMGDHQRHTPSSEKSISSRPRPPTLVGRGLGALEQPAIDQHRAPIGQPQLVARTGDALHGAVVGEVQISAGS